MINLKNTYMKYGVTTTISMWIKGVFGEVKNTRRNAFLGNASSLLALYEGILITDQGIYDGMSGAIISPHGTPDFELAEDLMRKNHSYRTELATGKNLLEENIDRVNVVGVVYNMLRMYYIKLYSQLKYEGKAPYYNNGHIMITNAQVFGDYDDGQLYNGIKILDQEVEVRFRKSGFTNDDDVLFYSFGNTVDSVTASVLRYAHAEWVMQQPFGLCHSSPQLAQSYVIVNGHARGQSMAFESISAAQIKAVIGDFVRKHMAYRDFDIAYTMVAGVMFKPVARSAEAILWNQTAAMVRIPKPYCLYGLMPELYAGVQYVRGPEWQDTFHSWYSSPGAMVAHSIALMEAVYTELFHLTRVADTDEITKDNFTQYATGIGNVPNTGILLDLALTCMRYGREVDLRYNVLCGVDRLDTIPSLNLVKPEVTVIDPQAKQTYDIGEVIAGVAPLNILDFAPVTYPSLSYGINDDQFYCNGTHYETCIDIHARARNTVFTDPEQFSAFMSMMRLFGYDVTAINQDGKHIVNWADNASGRYIYVHNERDLAPRFTIPMENIVPRANSWINMPTMYDKVTLGYQLEGQALCWFSGDEKIPFSTAAARPVSKTAYHDAILKMTQARPTIRIAPVTRKSGFRVTTLSVPPSRPILTQSSVGLTDGLPIDRGRQDVQEPSESFIPE